MTLPAQAFFSVTAVIFTLPYTANQTQLFGYSTRLFVSHMPARSGYKHACGPPECLIIDNTGFFFHYKECFCDLRELFMVLIQPIEVYSLCHVNMLHVKQHGNYKWHPMYVKKQMHKHYNTLYNIIFINILWWYLAWASCRGSIFEHTFEIGHHNPDFHGCQGSV